MITVNQWTLRRLFTYRDGALYWARPLPRSRAKPGDVAGCVNAHGYHVVKIARKQYRRNRLVWIYHYGDIPEGMEIDHRDTDRSNDCVHNLRLATKAQNGANRRPRSNPCGYVGVRRSGKRYAARIYVEGEEIYLGSFDTAEEAARAYDRAADEHHGEFATKNFPERVSA